MDFHESYDRESYCPTEIVAKNRPTGKGTGPTGRTPTKQTHNTTKATKLATLKFFETTRPPGNHDL